MPGVSITMKGIAVVTSSGATRIQAVPSLELHNAGT